MRALWRRKPKDHVVGDHGRTLRGYPGQAQRDEILLGVAESMRRIRYSTLRPIEGVTQ